MNLKRRGFFVERLAEFEKLCSNNGIEIVAGITKLNRKPSTKARHKVSLSDGPLSAKTDEEAQNAHTNRDKLRKVLSLEKLIFPMIEVRRDNVLTDPARLLANPRMMLDVDREDAREKSSSFMEEYRDVLGDAVILTNKESNRGVGCAVHVADCGAILIATKSKGGAIACVHSGWEGTRLNIVGKTLKKLSAEPNNTFVYVGPIVCGNCYEFGKDLYEKEFKLQKSYKKWIKPHPNDTDKVMFDNRKAITDQLLEYGIKEMNILTENICTMEDNNFYSVRKHGFTGFSAFAAAIGYSKD